jgi:hypothetical protein
MTHARHTDPGHSAKVACRVALGVVGAPVALLAVAGPADAAPLASVAHTAGGSLTDAVSQPVPWAVALPGPHDARSTLPYLVDFAPVDFMVPSLPGTDSLPVATDTDAVATVGRYHRAPHGFLDAGAPGADALPSTERLPSLPGPGALPSADAVSSSGLVAGLV